MPWVHWRDVVGLVDLALRDGELAGPLNAVGPELVTNRVFSRTMGEVLGRPSLVPTPPLALRVILGELARYVTMSQRVVPERARRHGYAFAYPQLRPALASLVGRGVRG